MKHHLSEFCLEFRKPAVTFLHKTPSITSKFRCTGSYNKPYNLEDLGLFCFLTLKKNCFMVRERKIVLLLKHPKTFVVTSGKMTDVYCTRFFTGISDTPRVYLHSGHNIRQTRTPVCSCMTTDSNAGHSCSGSL